MIVKDDTVQTPMGTNLQKVFKTATTPSQQETTAPSTERSELFLRILAVVKELPLKSVDYDCPDHISVSHSLESLFKSHLSSLLKERDEYRKFCEYILGITETSGPITGEYARRIGNIRHFIAEREKERGQ